MLFEFIENIKKYFESIYNIFNDNYDEAGIQSRMKMLETRYNSETCHPYKPHIFSLKSKNLLAYVNSLSNLDDKLSLFEKYNNILKNVCSKLYDRFDPTFIYTFNNEIHLVFYYNDEGHFQYDGNLNKSLSKMTSYASIMMSKELQQNDINIDFTFECSFVEFDIDYECLNYIIWRQLDCKRNITTLLYKCHKNDNSFNVNGLKLIDLENELYNNYSEDKIKNLLYGIIVKKELVQNEQSEKETNDDKHICVSSKEGFEITKESNTLYNRKKITYQHFWLYENFSRTMKMYVINKLLDYSCESEDECECNGCDDCECEECKNCNCEECDECEDTECDTECDKDQE